jgi:hypothetical protein
MLGRRRTDVCLSRAGEFPILWRAGRRWKKLQYVSAGARAPRLNLASDARPVPSIGIERDGPPDCDRSRAIGHDAAHDASRGRCACPPATATLELDVTETRER